jgi:hypothetical protein
LAAVYFTLATTAVTHPSESGKVLASVKVRIDLFGDVLVVCVFVFFYFCSKIFLSWGMYVVGNNGIF